MSTMPPYANWRNHPELIATVEARRLAVILIPELRQVRQQLLAVPPNAPEQEAWPYRLKWQVPSVASEGSRQGCTNSPRDIRRIL
jgi:hypothetical protein